MKLCAPKIFKLSLAITHFGLCLTTPLAARLHGQSHRFGKSLAGWFQLYERWLFGAQNVPTDSNGNALVNNHVVLLPLPNTPGDGTPGHLDVTLNAGQGFVLPLWALLGTDYTDGTPTDQLIDLSVFRTLDLTFNVDGVTAIDQSNVLNFYSQFFFNPPIPITGFPPINSIIWCQGIAVVYHPLSVGIHTLQLDAVNTQPAFGGFFEYHNTWTVTVQPSK
jgi:hypothetical protein